MFQIRSRYDNTSGLHDEIHPSGSGSGAGPATRYRSAYANVIGSYEDVDLTFEV
jgi:hypothetical protein